MEWPKLKNIIILILLLANLFLLVMVGVQEHGSAQYQEQALTNAVSVLGNNGIRIDSDRISDELELTAMTLSRDLESETALAQALLGACDRVDQGGGRYAYESPLGWAEFRSNGSFSVSFVNGTQAARQIGGEETHALRLMEEAGLTVVLESREETEDGVELILCQTWQNVPVYSCQITAKYQNGSLLTISGQRLMGTPQSVSGESEPISVPTALLRVLNGIDDLGDICNEITAMEPGYLLTASADGSRLIPMWYVTTDTGAYNLNALTGALERAQSKT